MRRFATLSLAAGLAACGPMDEGAPAADTLARAVAPPNPCPNPDATGVKVIPPATGAYQGAMLTPAGGGSVTDASITAFENLARKRLAWVYFDNYWGHDGVLDMRFPTQSVQTVWNHGAVPFIRFMPWTTRSQYQADLV